MSQSEGDDTIFQVITWMTIIGILFTVIGDVWIHWPVIGLIFIVSCWASQSMGKEKEHHDE